MFHLFVWATTDAQGIDRHTTWHGGMDDYDGNHPSVEAAQERVAELVKQWAARYRFRNYYAQIATTDETGKLKMIWWWNPFDGWNEGDFYETYGHPHRD